MIKIVSSTSIPLTELYPAIKRTQFDSARIAVDYLNGLLADHCCSFFLFKDDQVLSCNNSSFELLEFCKIEIV